MTSLAERAQMLMAASEIVDERYMTSLERIAISRFDEIYEAYKRDLDPDFQGLSFLAWGKAAKEAPEGAEAINKREELIRLILKSGKFGQVDWNV
jgi:L-ribulose-5-phosphate 3-epimerase UlaE